MRSTAVECDITGDDQGQRQQQGPRQRPRQSSATAPHLIAVPAAAVVADPERSRCQLIDLMESRMNQT
jgi:hypothetical protein